jgi:hypothetical protein
MDKRKIANVGYLLGSDIKKPTSLVHFQRTMPQLEQRIMTLLIFNAQHAEPDNEGHYEIRTQFVMEFLGWEKSNNYPRVYDAFRNIKGNEIVWNFLGEDRTLDDLFCSFLITLGISRRAGFIRYKFHPDIQRDIKNPNVFAKLKLIMLAVLARPKYAYPFYEFLADSYCRGKLADRISLAKLKDYLGIPAGSYTDYITFKDQVLKPSLAALNRISDYAATYRTYREGRCVAGIVFSIERKQNWQQPLLLQKQMDVLRRYYGLAGGAPEALPDDSPEVQRFITAVARHGINERTAREAVTAHGLTAAQEILVKVMRDIDRRKISANPINDVGAYLARCLKDGLGTLTDEERQAEADVAARKAEAHGRTQEHARIEAEQRERQERVRAFVAALTPEERANYERRFRETIDLAAYGSALKGKSVDAPGVKPIFMAFMAKELL